VNVQSSTSTIAGRIMIVDDEPVNIKVARKYLKIAGYTDFVTTSDSTQAIALMREGRPDLVLLDVMMPQVSGLDILQQVRGDDQLKHLPVLILTAVSDARTKVQALELGATDFLSKPVEPSELVPRVRNALVVKAHHDHLANYSHQLEREVRVRTVELEASRLHVVHCLARAAEFRDDDTGRHVMRVGRYAGIIARELGLASHHVSMLETAALLHDVGKIGIRDGILLKPGKLTPEEFKQMQQHCEIGMTIIQPLPEHQSDAHRMRAALGAQAITSLQSPLLDMAATIALTHHERWDGTGYPNRLVGEQIPIEGRITSVADVFDALCSKRPYKEAMPLEKALGIITGARGTQFDTRVVDALLRRLGEITSVQTQLADAA
jgi:putative two-component system response regulator